MYADRHARRELKPGSMAAAVGINVALIGALMFSSPEIFPVIETTLKTRNIPLAPPPRPPEPEPELKKSTPTPRDTVVAPPPKVPLTPTSDTTIVTRTDPPPMPTLPGGSATGTGTVTVDPPVAASVLVEASPDPRAARDFQPPYPPSERREGTEGRVTVRVLVGVDGRVKAFEPVRGDNAAFLDATRRQALSRWRFRPATRDGVPYESWRTMTVRFVLEG